MISQYASDVSAIPEVRAYPAWSCSGRWRGSTASSWTAGTSGPWCCRTRTVKVFLCARSWRRGRGGGCLELEQRGTPKPFDEVLREMEQRDYNDTHRAAAPLRPADDAIMIDNTDMDFAASLELLLDVIRGTCGIVRNKFYAAAVAGAAPAGAVFSAGGPAGNGASGGRRTGAAVRQPLQRLGPHPIRAVHAPAVQRAGHGQEAVVLASPSWVDSCGRSACFRWIGATRDIRAVKTAIQSLRDGWNLFLFPEGTTGEDTRDRRMSSPARA